MKISVLLALTVLMTLYGCGQSSPTPEQGEKEDVEKAVGEKKPEGTQKPETTARGAPGYTTSEQASASSNAEFDRGQCRINNYVAEENMSNVEIKSFTKEMVDYVFREEIERGRDVTFEDFLDYAGVPAYGDLCGGG